MNSHAAITGLGLITPLGCGVDQNWHALRAGEFIRDHAQVKMDGDGARINRLAIAAANEAIQHAKWNLKQLQDPMTALIVGTSKGPVENWISNSDETACPHADLSNGWGISQTQTAVARAINFGSGPRSTLSAACASGLHALIHATLLIKSGQARRALVVAAEASVHPLFVGSFKRLGVLPAEGVGCRPFDRNRDGFLMSEAAAAVCLDSDENAAAIASVDHVALAGDATHLTGGDPNGRVLRHLLAQVAGDRQVDLVHAHATGTKLHDPVELAAIESQVKPSPVIYSHKGAMGHSLGAAGLVSVVLNCMSHQTGVIPGNVQTRDPLPTKHVILSQHEIERRVQRSIVLATGFGGASAAVGLRRVVSSQ